MDFKELAIEIAKREGNKESIDIANIREVLSKLREILAEDINYKETVDMLLERRKSDND